MAHRSSPIAVSSLILSPMCGRFGLTRPDQLDLRRFGIGEAPAQPPRFNIAPGTDVLAIRQGKKGRRADLVHWGLVPSWAKDPAIGHRLVNARSDTALERPAFRIPMQKRRCLLPADVFYEWQGTSGQRGRQPWAVAMKDGAIFALGGLWDYWKGPGAAEGLVSCTILTTAPNDLLAPIHDRMPVIVASDDYDRWLDPGSPPQAVTALLAPVDSALMRAWPISSLVNDATVDDARVLEPVPARPR